MMKVWAIEHSLGLSLFTARTVEGALRKARRRFGEYGEPYSAPKDQEQQVAMAKQFGARIN